MKVTEVMKRDVECVKPTDTVALAAQKMAARNIGFLPVCDDGNNILGTITDRDIAIRIVAESRPMTTVISEAMTPGAVTVQEDEDLESAERLMARHQKSRIMVVDSIGKLYGVISLSDIAHHENRRRAGRLLEKVTDRETRP